MEGNLWDRVYQLLMTIDHTEIGQPVFSDRIIVLVALRAQMDDKLIAWATRVENRSGWRRPAELPSQPTMSRRLRSPSVQQLLQSNEAFLQRTPDSASVIAVDGRPLTISRFSNDPDADWGYAIRGVGFGYQFHAIWGDGPVPLAWQLCPLRAAEATVATQQLVPALPAARQRRFIVADFADDINRLDAAAATRGYQLLAPAQHSRRRLGRRPHHPDRIKAFRLLPTHRGRQLLAQQTTIENWAVRPEGLSELPKHVRRLHRVRWYVQGKLNLNGVRILMNRKQFQLPTP